MKSSPSMRPLTTGTALSASTDALIKNDIKPSLTPFFFVNFSCDFTRNSCTALMSHSLKVVRMAAVCCAITSCAAILRRSGDILLRVNRPSADWRSCSAGADGTTTPGGANGFPYRFALLCRGQHVAFGQTPSFAGTGDFFRLQMLSFNNASNCGRKGFLLFWRLFFPLFNTLFLCLGFFLFLRRFLGPLLLRWRLLIVNRRDYFANFHFLPFIGFGFEHAGLFRDNFSGNLVGLEREESFTFIHKVAGFLVPDGNDTARDRFADCGNFHFDRHQLGEGRGRAGFRQQLAPAP